MRQFYQHYFTAAAKLCWLRWLSVPQRLTMLEGLMQWDDRNSES
ncbi:glucose uptake inhibitor SgrT [Escherichia coli]|uniref:Glucose uptake inhibitor SgrT n=1 Tax=Escherichia coli O121 TaxID=1055537 RepID=A0AAP9MM53_ECOLX|nr:glucose uptake inhibitor SgrT [Escherichia coli]EFW8098968.1 glucose uptake inhibitor SgrT [Shigella sonnei]EHY1703140.1 glucose uptake inhibitor SgrT [Escherichia coli O21]AUF77139.1 glucose uptake inhibitor SgrT [Escherichia coli O121:H19]AWJ25222.1 glucose uptake inhibitor SgrT [Escherichia coli O121 str. RM8352]EEC9375414.1 glucose uptake inhibitor SgrT [Escherichia coli]